MKFLFFIILYMASLNLDAGIFGKKQFSCKFFPKGQVKREGIRMRTDDLTVENSKTCFFKIVGDDINNLLSFEITEEAYEDIKSFKQDLIDSLQSIYNKNMIEISDKSFEVEVTKKNYAHFLYRYYIQNERKMTLQEKKISTCLMYSEICKTKIVRKLLDLSNILLNLSLPLKAAKVFLKKLVFKKNKTPGELFKLLLEEFKEKDVEQEKEIMLLDITFKYYTVYLDPETDTEEWMVNKLQHFGNKKYIKVRRDKFTRKTAIEFLQDMTNQKLIDKANKFFKEKALSKVLGLVFSPLTDLVDLLDLLLFNDKGPICKDLQKKILDLQENNL